MNKLLWMPLLLVVMANAGCVRQCLNVADGELYILQKELWVPVLGSIVACPQPKPSESRKQRLDAEFEGATSAADESEKRVVPLTATVTDTP